MLVLILLNQVLGMMEHKKPHEKVHKLNTEAITYPLIVAFDGQPYLRINKHATIIVG